MSAPLRVQYLRLKQPFPDALLLFRLGDFYELYDEDARVAACELGVTLSMRAFAGGERIPLCPLPYHTAQGPIKRLVARGYKVAIAEQIGEPRTAYGLVAREVVRVVTPATAIEAQRHPPSVHGVGPSGAEPDGSGRSRTCQGWPPRLHPWLMKAGRNPQPRPPCNSRSSRGPWAAMAGRGRGRLSPGFLRPEIFRRCLA